MTVATVDRPPVHAAEMGVTEAKAITLAIKDNFDSLGSMLLQARDRKAYKALGYRSFDTYCKTEFGKSISHAYQLIEDAKIVAELETEISKQSEKPITLNFPSSHLRPLKEIPGITDKLKVITYAQKLAKEEGKKPTKQHLEIAIFEISGKRSEDFRKAIQGLGFTKGVPVEVTKSLKQDRGFVTKVDKRGKIYVELYDAGVVSILCDADELRILGDTEKPATPGNDFIIKKGDKVKIFAQGLEGKIGELYAWKMGKHAIVLIDGASSPISIAYAQLELIPEIEPIDITYAEMELIRGEHAEHKDINWDSELVWNAGKNTYYYFPQEDTIYSNIWPQGLALKPHSHEKKPIEFMKDWEDKFAGNLLEAFVTPERLKTLALGRAIQLPENEGKEFVADFIASLSQLFPQASSNTDALTEENRLLREQLAEAEVAIETMVNAVKALRETTTTKLLPKITNPSKPTLPDKIEGRIGLLVRRFEDEYRNAEPYQIVEIEGERINCLKASGFTEWIHESNLRVVVDQPIISELLAKDTTEFPVENASEDLAPGDTAAHTELPVEDADSTTSLLGADESWFSVLDSNDFIQSNIELDGVPTETYRGWDIYVYDSSLADISHLSKGTFSTDFTWVREKEIIKPVEWLKSIVNQIEDFCPGQLSLNLNPKISTKIKFFPQEMIDRVELERDKLFHRIENFQASKGKTKREQEQNAKKDLKALRHSLSQLEKFEQLKVGQTVWYKRNPEITGEITGFAFTTGGMPHVFVRWNEEEGKNSVISTEIVGGLLVSPPEL